MSTGEGHVAVDMRAVAWILEMRSGGDWPSLSPKLVRLLVGFSRFSSRGCFIR
jgi:hypothetical protein